MEIALLEDWWCSAWVSSSLPVPCPGSCQTQSHSSPSSSPEHRSRCRGDSRHLQGIGFWMENFPDPFVGRLGSAAENSFAPCWKLPWAAGRLHRLWHRLCTLGWQADFEGSKWSKRGLFSFWPANKSGSCNRANPCWETVGGMKAGDFCATKWKGVWDLRDQMFLLSSCFILHQDCIQEIIWEQWYHLRMELQFPISKWLNPSNSVTFFPQVQDHLAEALGLTEGIFPAHWKHHCHVMEASWGELWSCMWWRTMPACLWDWGCCSFLCCRISRGF